MFAVQYIVQKSRIYKFVTNLMEVPDIWYLHWQLIVIFSIHRDHFIDISYKISNSFIGRSFSIPATSFCTNPIVMSAVIVTENFSKMEEMTINFSMWTQAWFPLTRFHGIASSWPINCETVKGGWSLRVHTGSLVLSKLRVGDRSVCS